MIKYTIRHCDICHKDFKAKPDHSICINDQATEARAILDKYKPAEQINDLDDTDICLDCAAKIKQVDEETRYYFNALLAEKVKKKPKG